VATPMELVPMCGIGRRADLEPAPRFRQLRYLFDIALQAGDQGEPVFAATGMVADAERLVALVRRSGADNCDLRILASDGVGFGTMLAEVADRLCCDVYVTPLGADLLPGSPDTGLGRRGEAVAVDRTTGLPVRWQLVRPSDVDVTMPAWFARVEGAVRAHNGIALVPLQGGVAFATRSTFTHLCGLAGWLDDDPAGVTTVVVGNRDGAFEIGRYDGSARLVDGVHLAELVAAALPVVKSDVRLAITWPSSAEHRTGVEAQVARFAETLDRVVWTPDPKDAAAESWRAHSPRRPSGRPASSRPRLSTDNHPAHRVPHGVRWLPAAPPTNPEPLEMFVWTDCPVADVLDAGLPTAEPFLLLYADAARLAVRKRCGHLLSLSVPAGSVVDLYDVDAPLPAELRTIDTFLLPLAWLAGVTVTAGYDLDGAGGFAAAHRVDSRQLTVLRESWTGRAARFAT
jgi:hypothetical protein